LPQHRIGPGRVGRPRSNSPDLVEPSGDRNISANGPVPRPSHARFARSRTPVGIDRPPVFAAAASSAPIGGLLQLVRHLLIKRRRAALRLACTGCPKNVDKVLKIRWRGRARLERADAQRPGDVAQIRLGLRRAGDVFREPSAAVLILAADEPAGTRIELIGEPLAHQSRL
jgi:hypothetical protein